MAINYQNNEAIFQVISYKPNIEETVLSIKHSSTPAYKNFTPLNQKKKKKSCKLQDRQRKHHRHSGRGEVRWFLLLTLPFTATSRSASSNTMQGAFPPSSSETWKKITVNNKQHYHHELVNY